MSATVLNHAQIRSVGNSGITLLLLLLLTPNEILKKTENRVLLSVSEWGPSTARKDQKKEKIK